MPEGSDEYGYRDCIKQQISQEEGIYQEVATEVLNFLKIDQKELTMSQNMHVMNPAFQRVMMEMQLGVEEFASKLSITKEKAKEIFMFVEVEFVKCIQHYNLIQNPDIQKIMQKSLTSMQSETLNIIAQLKGGGASTVRGYSLQKKY